MDYLLVVSTGVWLTIVLTQSVLFEGYRSLFKKWALLDYMVYCALCTGFWVGLALTGVSLLVGFTLVQHVAIAPAVSLSSYAFSLWVGKYNADIERE